MLGHLLDGRYRIIQTLGAGGFGQTYIAEDTRLYNTKCVVKQLKPTATDPMTLQVARRLFESEAQLLHRLGSHDQIPRLLAHFEENQEFYLVQEFIDGHDLSRELTLGKRLSEPYCVALLENLLQPLAFVHQQHVIHRDIKPANLIRRKQDGKIVLIDFGAVKQIGTQVLNAQGQTRMTVSIGTVGYMPSEQSRGSPRLSSDMYAVGMIGLQALTGLMPHQLQEDPQTAEILWRDQVQVSQELADFLDRMVRYDFRQRYPSATEALQAAQQLAYSSYTPTEYARQQQTTPPQPVAPTVEPPREQSYPASVAKPEALGNRPDPQLNTPALPAIIPQFQNLNPAGTDIDREEMIFLSPAEMLHGAQKRLVLDNQAIEVRIPPGGRLGSRLRVRGKGRVNPYTQQRGDLYLYIETLESEPTVYG